jgi:uroporphyrinogen-III synthase
MRRPPPRDATPSVALVGGTETFAGLHVRLRRHGVALLRVPVIRATVLPLQGPDAIDAPGRFDTVLMTSRNAARALGTAPGLVAQLRRQPGLHVIAVGPGTAAALRQLGLHATWTAERGGSAAAVVHFHGSRPRSIFYPRSNRAGSRVGQALRRGGHTVVDPVAYRIDPPARVRPADAQALLRARCVVATSPSALSNLRAALDGVTFDRLRARTGLIVLGDRSARAARGHGFRGVRIAPTTAEEGFTQFLVGVIQHGS